MHASISTCGSASSAENRKCDRTALFRPHKDVYVWKKESYQSAEMKGSFISVALSESSDITSLTVD